MINYDNLPDDFFESHYFSGQSDWNGGDRKVLCYVQSESGFPGPVITRE